MFKMIIVTYIDKILFSYVYYQFFEFFLYKSQTNESNLLYKLRLNILNIISFRKIQNRNQWLHFLIFL